MTRGRPRTPGLTPRESDCLAVIVAHWQAHSTGPSRREIAAALGLRSTCSVQVLVDRLADKGLVKRGRYGYRDLKPTGTEAPAEIIARLTRECERLRQALAFYADLGDYARHDREGVGLSEIDRDGGDRARLALSADRSAQC